MKHNMTGLEPRRHPVCRYDPSRLSFRGPKRRLDSDYVAFLGGTETYGKFIDTPFVAQIEALIGMTALNLGCVNAGVDAFYKDRGVIDMCRSARAVVMQMVGAHNLSNRFYTVHPRRNDRFLRASSVLQHLYADVDFADYSFTRHLLTDLYLIDPDRFAIVREELQIAWKARMRSLITEVERPVVLLWFAEHRPDEDIAQTDAPMQREPLFVTRGMIEEIRETAAQVVEVSPSPKSPQDRLSGLRYGAEEAHIAAQMLGLAAHEQATAALIGPVRRVLAAHKKGPAPQGAPSDRVIALDQSLSVSSGTAWNRSATRP